MGVDEAFGVLGADGSYVPTASNITFNEGDTLEVTDVTIELIKAK